MSSEDLRTATPSERAPLSVLMYTDDGEKHSSEHYDVVMLIDVSRSPWEQLSELISLAGAAESMTDTELPRTISVVIEGTLGRNSVEYAKELAKHANVTWRTYRASVAPLREATGGAIKIEELPQRED